MNQQYVSTTVICLKPIKKIWNKKCKIDECNNRSKINGVCVKHGAITPRCKIEECGKKSIKNGVCINHGAKQPRCKIEGCDKYSKKNGVCVKHGAKVHSKKCTSCALFVVHLKTNYLCYYCNPNKKKRQQTKELIVKDLLETSFPCFKFIHNKSFEFDTICTISKYRPDFLLHCTTHYIVIECDESYHSQYPCDCEIKR